MKLWWILITTTKINKVRKVHKSHTRQQTHPSNLTFFFLDRPILRRLQLGIWRAGLVPAPNLAAESLRSSGSVPAIILSGPAAANALRLIISAAVQ